MVLAFVLQILFRKYYLYIPSLHCKGIFRLCFNDSFFLFGANCCFPKRKKGVGGNVRSLRLKNWLPLESAIMYIRLLDYNTLKVCYILNLDHSFY